MNKQEIIEALNNAIQPDETYYLNENLIQEINNYPNPAEFVEPILELIEKNPRPQRYKTRNIQNDCERVKIIKYNT